MILNEAGHIRSWSSSLKSGLAVFRVFQPVPERLRGRQEVANKGKLVKEGLPIRFYSWDRSVRGLFFRIDSQLWEHCGHNPKVFLRRVSQQRLDTLAQDRDFVLRYQEVLASFNAYMTPDLAGSQHPRYWVSGQKVHVENGRVTGYRVALYVTLIVH